MGLGAAASAAATFTPSEHFNTVLYTGTGASQRIGGYINRGAVFNGSSSYIDLGNNSSNNGSLISVSCWFRTTSTSAAQIWNNGGNDSSSTGLALKTLASGVLYFQANTGGTSVNDTGTTTINDGDWHHVVVNYDNGDFNVYLDGSSTAELTGTSSAFTTTANQNFLIGRLSRVATDYFNGVIDQFRIFNRELTTSEVTTLYGETHSSTTISTTDIFSDNSGVALYQLDGNANATGSVPEIAFDSTINTSSIAYTVNNRKIAGNTSGSYASTRVTESKSSGKWYFEMYYNDSSYFPSSRSGLGLVCPTCTMGSYLGGTAQDDWAVFNGGNVRNNNSTVHNENLGDFSAGNVIMCALDLDNQKVYFGKNGTWFNSANPSNGTNSFTLSGSEYYAAGWVYNTSDQLTFRFREGDFSYTVPTGFSAYSETNYDGTASNVTYQEATKFTPDLVWIKRRDSGIGDTNHLLFDSVRGTGERLMPNLANAESTETDELTSFDSNGFTVGADASTNGSGGSIVAWCFNAGSGSAALNENGNIDSNVKVNTDAGFSIVSWQGAGTGGNYIGHGLGVKPQLIIIKNRDNARNFRTYVEALGATKFINLDTTEAAATYGSFGDTEPTTDVFYTSTVSAADRATNYAGEDFIAYCFHDVAGYQKIGSYTGTGSAGNIVETGFEPAFLLIKQTNISGSNWNIIDNKRDTENPRDVVLWADTTDTESTASQSGVYDVNFLSNGFSLENTYQPFNASGGTYIYLAIAADPDTTTPTVADSFDVVTYSGTGAAQDIETDFKPDLAWIKSRSHSTSHELHDSVRGEFSRISSDTTAAASTTANGFVSLTDNGFSLDGAGGGGEVNTSGRTYVAWCWKAGDHDDNLPQINTEGSSGGSTLESIVSVNDAAGFSIVKGTAISSGAFTVGHGLSAAPELYVIKNTSGTGSWIVYANVLGNDKYLILNSSAAAATSTLFWNNTAPSSTVFQMNAGQVITGGADFIAYCWYSVSGHSKIGKYSGSGSSGKQVTGLGFKPRFLMIKRTDLAGGWRIQDDSRLGTSGTQKNVLEWNDPAAEQSNYVDISFDTDGFTLNTTTGDYNASGTDNYIYMAFK